MVRKHNSIHAAFESSDCILDRLDAFDYNWQFGDTSEPVDRTPRDIRVDKACVRFGDTDALRCLNNSLNLLFDLVQCQQ